jgi:hypothetical protein
MRCYFISCTLKFGQGNGFCTLLTPNSILRIEEVELSVFTGYDLRTELLVKVYNIHKLSNAKIVHLWHKTRILIYVFDSESTYVTSKKTLSLFCLAI